MIPEKITQEFIESKIQKISYNYDTDSAKYLNCIIEIENGFKVVGTAYRQFAVEHDPDIATKAAYDKAIDKLWEYYCFLSHVVHKGDSLE